MYFLWTLQFLNGFFVTIMCHIWIFKWMGKPPDNGLLLWLYWVISYVCLKRGGLATGGCLTTLYCWTVLCYGECSQSGDLSTDGRVMWKWTLNKKGVLVPMGTGFIWLRMGPIGSMFWTCSVHLSILFVDPFVSCYYYVTDASSFQSHNPQDILLVFFVLQILC